jgi:outer membrane protein TolC
MIMKRYIVLVSTFVCGLLCVQAETLTLDECRSRALEYNKSLASSKLQIQKQEADLKAMKTNFLPNFKIIAADFYNTGKTTINPDLSTTFASGIANAQNVLAQLAANPAYTPLIGGIKSIANGFKMPDDFLEFKIGNVFTAGVSFIEPLYAGGKITAGYKMNKLGVSMAQNKVRLTEQEVLLNTDNAYVLCVRAKEMGGVARSYKAVLDELKKTVENARKHGVRTQNDVLKVQVKLNEAELNILKADNAYRLAQMNLAQVIGAPLTERIEVTTDGLNIPTDNNVLFDGSTDISNRPEYDLLNQKTEMARLKIKLTRSDFLPNLAMFGSYSYLNGMKLMGERLFNKGSATVGVVLKVPLFHFGEGIQKVRSAKAAYQISQLEQQELNEKMQLELLQATNLLQEAALEIAVTNKSVEQAAENMRLSKRHYEVGTETLSDHLEAQALWQQANASSVEARCNYLVAYTKYMKARGGK